MSYLSWTFLPLGLQGPGKSKISPRFSFLWLVRLLLSLYQDRLHTLLIRLPAFPFQWHPSFEYVSLLLNQLCIEMLEGSAAPLFELHIWFNPLVIFCLFIWLLL